jgi:hypothetical protein
LAKYSSHILELARKGAEHRYEELHAEIAQLRGHFPDLLGRNPKKASVTTSVSHEAEAPPRNRRTLSAKGRAAIAAAQKKRWAKQRAAGGKK